MAVDLLTQRTDLPYLRRRVRPGSQPAKPVQPVERVSLRLSAPDAVEKSKYTVPTLASDVTLSATNPVVRLNRRQAAIGSLSIAGATDFAWEAAGATGAEIIGPNDDQSGAPSYANRPLVQQYKGTVVLGLRHARALRRLLVRSPGQLTVTLYAGRKITVVAGATGARLLVTRIGDVLELRREEAASNFGFTQLAAEIAPQRSTDPYAGIRYDLDTRDLEARIRAQEAAGRTPGRPTRAQVALNEVQHYGTGERAHLRRDAERTERERRLRAREAVFNKNSVGGSWRAEFLEDLSSDMSSQDIYRKYTS